MYCLTPSMRFWNSTRATFMLLIMLPMLPTIVANMSTPAKKSATTNTCSSSFSGCGVSPATTWYTLITASYHYCDLQQNMESWSSFQFWSKNAHVETFIKNIPNHMQIYSTYTLIYATMYTFLSPVVFAWAVLVFEATISHAALSMSHPPYAESVTYLNNSAYGRPQYPVKQFRYPNARLQQTGNEILDISQSYYALVAKDAQRQYARLVFLNQSCDRLCWNTTFCNAERTNSSKRLDNANVRAKLEATDEPCLHEIAENSQLLYVKRDAKVDMEICYDAQQAKTFYVKFVIDGPAMAKIEKPDDRPTKFMVGENRRLFPDHLPCYYTKSHQKALFEKYYKMSKGIDSSSFLAKGHLASNGDFLTTEQKEGSFYYANVTPQWQSINSKAWNNVESSVRRLAKKTSSKFTVYTGTHDQMVVRNKLVYLTKDNRIPVPKWLWKVVINEKTNQGVGIICTNDPFNELKPPCGSLEFCDENNWKNFGNNKTTGKVYCCTVDRLIGAIPEANEIQEEVTDVLRGPLLSMAAVTQLKVKAGRLVKVVKEKIKKKKDEKASTNSKDVVDTASRSPVRPTAKKSLSPRKYKSKGYDPDYVVE